MKKLCMDFKIFLNQNKPSFCNHAEVPSDKLPSISIRQVLSTSPFHRWGQLNCASEQASKLSRGLPHPQAAPRCQRTRTHSSIRLASGICGLFTFQLQLGPVLKRWLREADKQTDRSMVYSAASSNGQNQKQNRAWSWRGETVALTPDPYPWIPTLTLGPPVLRTGNLSRAEKWGGSAFSFYTVLPFKPLQRWVGISHQDRKDSEPGYSLLSAAHPPPRGP